VEEEEEYEKKLSKARGEKSKIIVKYYSRVPPRNLLSSLFVVQKDLYKLLSRIIDLKTLCNARKYTNDWASQ